MTRRGEILQAFIENGFIASPRVDTVSREGTDISVAVYAMRKRGYAVETVRGLGHRLTDEDRQRLAADPWALASVERQTGASSVLVDIPRDSLRILNEIAEERGKPMREIARICLENGIEAELGT